MRELKVDVISREIVKPISPTPPHLRNLSLSFVDQVHPSFLVPTIFFYPMKTLHNHDIPQRLHLLKKTLSETLTRFYPLAGRIRNNSFIECNDEGAYFSEAIINCKLSDILEQPELESLCHFMPEKTLENVAVPMGCMLLVQFTIFECGSTAICAQISHKFGDALSMFTFLKCWALCTEALVASDGGLYEPLCPEFMGASLLPSVDGWVHPLMGEKSRPTTTRRYVFDALHIQALKSNVTISTGFQPTQVEVVLGFIFKCIITTLKSGSPSSIMLRHLVNIRRRITQPLSNHSIGNLSLPYKIFVNESERELELIVCKLRKGLQDFCNNTVNNFKGEEGLSMINDGFEAITGIDPFTCSSVCGFGLYEMDFGWGKPIWVTTTNPKCRKKNLILLVDTRLDDGIEAWVTLEEQDMIIFQADDKMLEYATYNPSL